MTMLSPIQDGDRGNPEIDLPAAHDQADPAVLGEAPLGDVELRHDLDPGDDGGLESLGGGLDIVKNAVDAVPDLHLVLEGLDVDVACAALDGLRDQKVDDLDDRRLRGQVLQVPHVIDLFLAERGALFVHRFDDPVDVLGLLGIEFGKVLVDHPGVAAVDHDIA